MKATQNFNENYKKDNVVKKDTDMRVQHHEKKLYKPDSFKLNLSFTECAVWFFIMITLPPLVLILNQKLLIPLAPLLAYLELTALIHWCPIRFVYDKFIAHKQDKEICDFPEDLDIPVKAV